RAQVDGLDHPRVRDAGLRHGARRLATLGRPRTLVAARRDRDGASRTRERAPLGRRPPPAARTSRSRPGRDADAARNPPAPRRPSPAEQLIRSDAASFGKRRRESQVESWQRPPRQPPAQAARGDGARSGSHAAASPSDQLTTEVEPRLAEY